MNPALAEAAFITLAALSAVALWRLADPNSWLSKLVDGKKEKR